MQTFLPLPDFADSAACLDLRRLGKQRVEAMQILHCILGIASLGWSAHPAVRMWAAYPQALASYGLAICDEWRGRGCFDTAGDEFSRILSTMPDWDDSMWPHWFGEPAFHASHRAALLAKAPEHYSVFGWNETPVIDYVWPTGSPSNALT